MKAFIDEYGLFVIGVIIAALLASQLFTFTYKNEDIKDAVARPEYYSAGNNAVLAAKEKPILEVTNGVIFTGTNDFDAKDYIVKAQDADGNNLIDSVVVSGADFDVNIPGEYIINYIVEDSNHLIAKAQAVIRVEDEPVFPEDE